MIDVYCLCDAQIQFFLKKETVIQNKGGYRTMHVLHAK